MEKKASFDQYLQLGHMVSAGTISCKLMQAILGGRVEIIDEPREQTGSLFRGGVPSVESRDLITVPDLSAAELTKLAREKLSLAYLDDDLVKWNFIMDERGKTYEVKSWKPAREVMPVVEVQNHFTDGFVGNTAAFITLMIRDNPEGYHSSIPESSRLLRNGCNVQAPIFVRERRRGRMRAGDAVRNLLPRNACLWAFCEVK